MTIARHCSVAITSPARSLISAIPGLKRLPVEPAGVGPLRAEAEPRGELTIAVLVEQTVRAASRRAGLTDSIQVP